MIAILDRVAAALAVLIVAMTALVTCLAVFFRSVLGASLPWPEELSGNAIVWTSFLGAYLATRDYKHICFDLLIERLSPLASKLVQTLADLCVISLFALLSYQSARMISVVGSRSLETINLPVGVFMAALPICGSAIALAFCIRIALRWGLCK